MEGKPAFWIRSILIAIAYGVAYSGLRALSLSGISGINWIPVAGLRFACLLLTPTRYWPALLVGEAAPLGYSNFECLELFGLRWVLVSSVPHMLYCAPIVYLMRKRLPSLDSGLCQRNVSALLLCMFIISLMSALHGTLNYSLPTHRAPGEQVMNLWFFGSRLLTSNYLSLVTVIPVLLWMTSAVQQVGVRWQFDPRLAFSPWLERRWCGTWALLGIILALAMAEHYASISTRYLVPCGMLAALTTAAWCYGWQSTAIVSAAANLGIVALMPTRNDPLTIQMQCAIAVMMSGLLLLGVRTSAARRISKGLESSRRIARQELFAVERSRLTYACELDAVFSDARKEATRMLHLMRTALPNVTLAEHYHRFDALHQEHQRLTACMSPRAWWESNGPHGPIAEALELLGINCNVARPPKEADLLRLPAELCIALYRLGCEAAVYLIEHAPTDQVHLVTAMRESDSSMIVSLTLESRGEILVGMDDTQDAPHEQLCLILGTAGLDEKAMRQRAQLYDGDIRIVRTSPDHLRIVLWVCHRPPA